jgi:hypothetical protein
MCSVGTIDIPEVKRVSGTTALILRRNRESVVTVKCGSCGTDRVEYDAGMCTLCAPTRPVKPYRTNYHPAPWAK